MMTFVRREKEAASDNAADPASTAGNEGASPLHQELLAQTQLAQNYSPELHEWQFLMQHRQVPGDHRMARRSLVSSRDGSSSIP